MKLRLISRLMVASLAVVLGAVMLIHSRLDASQAAPAHALQGTSLGDVPAPNFTLLDQNGVAVSLNTLKGFPVVLTFMSTKCAEACSHAADWLSVAAQQLGQQASRVAWVAISVDPAGDTPEGAAAFVAQHRLTGYLRYLLGTPPQLAPLWHAYGVVPESDPGAGSNGAQVNHGFGVFVLDGQGRERVYLGYPFEPSVLNADLRVLLAG